MLSAVLKSDTAIQTSIKIINSFVQMRKFLLDNASIFQRFDKIEQQLLLYLDDTVLTLFSKVPNIQVTIYTHIISKQLKLDYEKYSKQYGNITLKTFKNSHDRFMILDKKEIFHLGASLKDLGKKWFAFSKINIDVDDLLSKLN